MPYLYRNAILKGHSLEVEGECFHTVNILKALKKIILIHKRDFVKGYAKVIVLTIKHRNLDYTVSHGPSFNLRHRAKLPEQSLKAYNLAVKRQKKS